jgi:hypothetical protein
MNCARWTRLLFVVALMPSVPGLAQVNILTHHNDSSRTGTNLSETVLNTSNVNVNQFGKLFSIPVDGQIYAQPLYVPNLSIPSQGTHNVLYVATEANSVFAFDADAGGSALWQKNLGTPANCNPSTPDPLTYLDCTTPYNAWYNMFPIVGITATPVIDPTTKTMYLVNVALVNGQQQHFLHALDLTTGNEKFAGPVQIQASVPGTGYGGNTVVYDPVHARVRTALSLVNGLVVWGAGAYSDWQPYHGWVFAYNAATLQRVGAWCDTPNGTEGGIWQGGGGFVADAGGNVYLTSGNGDFDGVKNFGMSVIKLGVSSSGINLLDFFSPSNEAILSSMDMDLGSSGPVGIPGTNYLVAGGKEGKLYLMDTSNLGKFNSSADQVVQEFQATTGPSGYYSHIHGAPVYWKGPSGQFVYIWGESDHLKAFRFTGSAFQTTPASQSTSYAPDVGYAAVCATSGGDNESCMPGGFLSLSANGNTAGTAIIWGNTALSGNAEAHIQPGILHAYDAGDLTKELWDSRQNASRDDYGYFAKFVPPTVANGKVYMATFSNQLVVYGILPNSFSPLRVNAGGPSYLDPSGPAWSADANFIGGSTYSTGNSISGTSTPTLYQTERYGNLQYQFNVPNGTYTVNLKFAEIFMSAPGQRVFNVAINGSAVLTNFDIVAQAGAPFRALDKAFSVPVTTGSISIQFTSVVNNAKISALEILQSGTGAVAVSLSPNGVFLGPSQLQQFTAAVTGTSNTAVTWSLNPVVGSISSSGLYTAPATIPMTQNIAVTAISNADNSKSATATITLMPGFTPIRINAAGPAYTDAAANVWSADLGFTGGNLYGTTNAISGTTTPTLYQTERYGDFQYQFNVANGTYTVNLKFAEIFISQPGQRLFNVAINGSMVLSSFDILAQAGAAFTALDKPFAISVTTGAINIQFISVVNYAKISAIEILQTGNGAVAVNVSPNTASLGPSQQQQFTASVTGTSNTAVTWSLNPTMGSIAASGLYTAPATVSAAQNIVVTAISIADPSKSGTATLTLMPFTPIRVNAGGPAYTDPANNVWSADTGFNAGNLYSTTNAIVGTGTPNLYQTERYGDFQYQFNVPNGTYTVNLKFAEIFMTSRGERVFNVAINGSTVLSNFDIVGQAGTAFTALDKSFPVSVNTGVITIQFTSVVNYAKISAIEIR